MDYKKIIPSRNVRTKILSLLSWIPDRIMIPLQYKIHTGRSLNTKNPQRFTEKLQLYKLKYRNHQMHRCTDKYDVRKYVAEKGFSDILVPLIGIYNSVDEINYDDLPLQFVAKTSDGGGGNQILICRDKRLLDRDVFLSKLQGWMSQPRPRKHVAREWAYDNRRSRRIIIEKLITDGSHEGINDYKFFCFEGKVGFVYGISDRRCGQSAQIGIYDRDFNKLKVYRKDERPQDHPLSKPTNYESMILIAEQLSSEFPHVRVDLYNVDGQIYFGELTFYDGSGYMEFEPDGFDFEAGKYFDITSFNK